jgi:hypothetical protein
MDYKQSMENLSKSLTLGVFIALICLSPLHAQSGTPAPADASTTASPASPAQAPDEVTSKITDLVHAGKYAEAQQLTTGLLLAYPDDQRLIKAKQLLDKLLSSGGSATGTPGTNSAAEAAPNPNVINLTGMDKVDYEALIELAKQAQQTTDLEQQKTLLNQFMAQSVVFLQRHPTATLLWQLRAASAISLNDPTQGYEAGQKLVAMGAADGNDANAQRLLAQLKNKGWLDKQDVEVQQGQEDLKRKFAWLVGTWKVSWRWNITRAYADDHERGGEVFVLSGSTIEGYEISNAGLRASVPDLRADISGLSPTSNLESVKWECYLPTAEPGDIFIFRHHFPLGSNAFYTIGHRFEGWEQKRPYYPFGWQPVISAESGGSRNAMTITIPSQNLHENSDEHLKKPVVLTFTKISEPPNQPASEQP